MEPTSPTESNQGAKPQRQKRKIWGKALLVLLLLLLLGLIGWLAWQLKLCQDQHAKDSTDKQSLQSKVDDLTKQLDEAKKSAAASETDTTPGVCSTQKELTTELKENLAAAISSKNTAALKGYMADKVNVVFAASEKGGEVSQDQAVTDLNYLNSATAPWDFNLSAATLNSYKDGDYAQYFNGVTYVGKSSDGYVISFGFDACAKINRIFVSVSSDLL